MALLLLSVLVAAAFSLVLCFANRVHEWFYERKLGDKRLHLPPGDLGWPFLGSMVSFFCAFKLFKDPDAFINGFVKSFGRIGVYKSFMFGSPTILITVPRLCRQVLMDDESFGPGWPRATVELIGPKSFIGISQEQHKRLRKVTAAPLELGRVWRCTAWQIYFDADDGIDQTRINFLFTSHCNIFLLPNSTDPRKH